MENLKQFYADFQSEVIDFALGGESGEDADFKENAFTSILAEDLSTAGILESPVVCYHEAGPSTRRMKVNGCSIPEEDSQLDLFVSLYHGTPEPTRVGAKEIDRAFSQLSRFLESAIQGYHEKMEPGSDACALFQEVWGVKDAIDRIRFFLLTDGEVVQRKEKERKDAIGKYSVAYEIWDIERIRRFRSSGATHESVEVELSGLPGGGVPCVQIPNDSLGYSTCAAILPGKLLHDLYDEYGQRLMELNVRSYLQAKGKVNKGILETLLIAPERFLAYNNGITLVAEALEISPLAGGAPGITSIRGLQIVNGGQTTASIHRAGKERKADLSKVFVQAKITVIDREQFDSLVPLISKFANSQNKVSEVDLGANHAYHVGVERVSRSKWMPGEQSMWFYERARGSYQTQKARSATTPARKREFEKRYPPRQRFSKEDLARYENCWRELPHVVSRGGQKNFAAFMGRVGHLAEGWSPSPKEYEELIGKAILYRQAQRIAREVEIPAFRVNVVNYTIAVLAHRTARRIDLKGIWDRQGLSDALEAVIRDWVVKVEVALVDSAGSRNPTEWFKKEECWKAIKSLDLSLPQALKSELAAPTADSAANGTGEIPDGFADEDLTNMARCMEVDAPQWHAIMLWGNETGELRDWQCGIANTLSGMAARGWAQRPSKKQALRGAEILDVAEEFLSQLGN